MGKRPDRATIVYAISSAQTYRDVPILIGGVEASLRRLAHYDYWSDQMRRSILLDSPGRPAPPTNGGSRASRRWPMD